METTSVILPLVYSGRAIIVLVAPDVLSRQNSRVLLILRKNYDPRTQTNSTIHSYYRVANRKEMVKEAVCDFDELGNVKLK